MQTLNTQNFSESKLLLRFYFSIFAIPESEVSALKPPFKRYPFFCHIISSKAVKFLIWACCQLDFHVW